MRKFGLMLTVLVLITSTVGCAGRPGKTPDLHFEPNGLYGRINGGSELFLEFGFVGLDIFQVGGTAEDPEIDVEVYNMTDVASALGIYLAKCGNEKPVPGVVGRSTGSPYQITAVAGTVFLQVNSFSGDKDRLPQMVSLANGVLGRHVSGGQLPVWRHLPQANRVAGTEFMFRGQYALDPVYTFGEGNILQISGDTIGVGARFDDGNGVYKRLSVEYQDVVAASAALVHLKANLDSYITVVESSDNGLVFKDYANKFGVVKLIDNRLDIAVNLAPADVLNL